MVPAAAVLLSVLGTSDDAPRRFGVFVGSNAGGPGRSELRYAHADAERIRDVFLEVGGMKPGDSVVLRDPRPAAIVDTIRAVSDRAAASPEAVLVFYYSGHADDRALLLGERELAFADLVRALEDAPVGLGLHVIDACRSGALTRKKGARLGRRVEVQARDSGEGKVVITSSAQWEDALESDRLEGSFFTLHLASALRGAADEDRDARVTLKEAYAYVYGRTVESTLGSAGGPQHPTFAYDLRGRGELVLSWTATGRDVGIVELGTNATYLFLDDETSRVLAEVSVADAAYRLAMREGPVRVTKHGAGAHRTGRFVVRADRTIRADDLLKERPAYGRWVRKGGRYAPSVAHAVFAETGWRGPLSRGIPGAPSTRLRYELSTSWLSISPRITLGLPARVTAALLTFEVWELSAGVEVHRIFDFPLGSLSVGIFGDAVWLSQREANAREAARNAGAVALGVAVGAQARPIGGFSFGLRFEGGAFVFPVTDDPRPPADERRDHLAFTHRTLLTIGYEL